MAKPTTEDLLNRFYYHPPTPETIPKHTQVNDLTFETARKLVDLCPDGRNLSLALTALEDCRMRANAAIACDTPRP